VIGIVSRSRFGVHLTRTLVHLRVDTLEAFFVPTTLLNHSGLKTHVRSRLRRLSTCDIAYGYKLHPKTTAHRRISKAGCIFLRIQKTDAFFVKSNDYLQFAYKGREYLGMLGHSGCNEVPKPPAKRVHGLAQYKRVAGCYTEPYERTHQY
jgi:hypothetical protein